MRISSKALHQLIREEIKQLREETDEEWARRVFADANEESGRTSREEAEKTDALSVGDTIQVTDTGHSAVGNIPPGTYRVYDVDLTLDDDPPDVSIENTSSGQRFRKIPSRAILENPSIFNVRPATDPEPPWDPHELLQAPDDDDEPIELDRADDDAPVQDTGPEAEEVNTLRVGDVIRANDDIGQLFGGDLPPGAYEIIDFDEDGDLYIANTGLGLRFSGIKPDEILKNPDIFDVIPGSSSDLQGTTTRVAPVSGPDPSSDRDPIGTTDDFELPSPRDENPEELELDLDDPDPEETVPTAEPVAGPDPRLADTSPGGFPPVSGPDAEGPAVTEPLQKATNVKDFFYSFGDLARKSLGDDIETQATIITDLHRARKGLQALAYAEPLFGDGDTVNVDPGDLSKVLSKVYDFGLGQAAAPFKLNLAKLVDKAVQRQKDVAKDKEFYSPTGDREPGMSSPRGSSSAVSSRPAASTSGASDWITESKDLSSTAITSFKRFKKLAGIK